MPLLLVRQLGRPGHCVDLGEKNGSFGDFFDETVITCFLDKVLFLLVVAQSGMESTRATSTFDPFLALPRSGEQFTQLACSSFFTVHF